MMILAEILVSALLVVGGLFGLFGSYALVKLDDPMKRLHGPTQSATLGVGGVLLASMLYNPLFLGWWSWHELLITLFVVLVAPVTGYFIAKAVMHLDHVPADLPAPATDCCWATYGPGDLPPDGKVSEDSRM